MDRYLMFSVGATETGGWGAFVCFTEELRARRDHIRLCVFLVAITATLSKRSCQRWRYGIQWPLEVRASRPDPTANNHRAKGPTKYVDQCQLIRYWTPNPLRG